MAPLAFLPAFFKAISSACGLPVALVTAFDIIILFLEITHPTVGLGKVLPKFFLLIQNHCHQMLLN